MVLKKILIDIRDLGIFLLDGMVKFFICSYIKNTANKVLFIRTDAIGDFVLWLDSAKKLREHYSDKHITLICNAINIELAKRLPYFDEVIPINPKKFRKNLFNRYQFFRKICIYDYEMVIHFPFTRHIYFLDGEAIVRFVRSLRKIGSSGEPSYNFRKKISNFFYTELIPTQKGVLIELERNAEFLRGLGISEYQAKIYRFPDAFFQPVEQEFDYIIFPGASSVKRRWPLENFARISEFLYQKKSWRGIICGGVEEVILGEELQNLSSAPLVNYVGKTSLVELVSTIAKAKLLISNETSSVHIAASVNTHSICVVGGGHYQRFMPYQSYNSLSLLLISVMHKMDCFGCNWNCIYNTAPNEPYCCIKEVTVKQVIEALEKFLMIEKTDESVNE